MKRYDGRKKPEPRQTPAGDTASAPVEHMCLVRATLANKKISSVIHQKDLNRFHQAYANVLKGNIDGLKKRDRKAVATTPGKSTKSSKAT